MKGRAVKGEGVLHEGTPPSVTKRTYGTHPTGMHSYFSIVHECKERGVCRLIHSGS